MNRDIDNLEEILKNKYNEYIDSLVNYLDSLENTEANNAHKYILDNHISVGFRNSLEIVWARSTKSLIDKKVM